MLLEKSHSCHRQCAEHSCSCHAACDHKNDLPVGGNKVISLNSTVGKKPQPHKENKSDEPMKERAFRPAADKTAVVHITDLAVCDTIGDHIDEYNRPSEIWINDVEIFYNNYLTTHSLSDRIKRILDKRDLYAYNQLITCLESIRKDKFFIEKINVDNKVFDGKQKSMLEYDVFISHANKDKEDLIEELYQSLYKLGINIFYDKESLEWGDNWKERILNGTKKAEFAIIVISENFFDREWTERELSEFLNRQNRNGQKLILPIVHNITMQQLQKKYPNVANIQAIDSKKYNCDQIALLFAKQLIKRLKAN